MIGRLGLQLTLAFVGVALAAALSGLLIFSLTVSADFRGLVEQQNGDLTGSVARAAGAAYGRTGWAHANLKPILALGAGTGGGIEIKNNAGHLVRSSPGFASIALRGPTFTRAIFAGRQRVGSATVAFDHGRLYQLVAAFQAQRWNARVASLIMAVLIALVVALPLSRMITAPVDRLIWVARARVRDSAVRVGAVRGFGKLNQLAMAFDEMADAREAQDQLRRNLLADVAHELRTPIAVLQAGHEAMLDGVSSPTPVQISSLRDEVLRLARMVNDLQRLASAEEAALQLTLVRRDLASVVATAAASLVDSFEAANVTLVEQLGRVDVMVDPLRMHEVVLNLLTNALKFTPAGGQVTLETKEVNATGTLRVSDTGMGIPPDELPHVAERFYRGQRSADIAGSGIGLTIVGELVRAHYGTFRIASELGRGTTVTVTLPLARSGRPGKRGPQRQHGPPPGSRRQHVGIIGTQTRQALRLARAIVCAGVPGHAPAISGRLQRARRGRSPGWRRQNPSASSSRPP